MYLSNYYVFTVSAPVSSQNKPPKIRQYLVCVDRSVRFDPKLEALGPRLSPLRNQSYLWSLLMDTDVRFSSLGFAAVFFLAKI